MQVGALLVSIATVAMSAVLFKLDSWFLGGVFLVYGFYKAGKVFAPPTPPFGQW